MITLTESAKKQIEQLCKENSVFAITLNMKGGGCAGLEYDWNTAQTHEDIEANSTVLEAGEGRLAVGPMSLLYLVGTTIDYKKNITGASFVLDNPNTKSTCGCGVSVNIDMDKIAAV
jgi:iron-sulfur cluster assembly accessory protein